MGTSDKFSILSIQRLLYMMQESLKQGHFLGLHQSLFYKRKESFYSGKRFDQFLETPLGVAAGPHTQLAQNILGAWLSGARYIELKTVQTLDELNVSKPCIDMQEEGYNCEWSQELRMQQSFDQYLNAWILLHILNDMPDFNLNAGLGTIFNMSVGYNLEGIKAENVQWFFSKMKNCKAEKEFKLDSSVPTSQGYSGS